MIVVTSLKDHADVCKSLKASHLISVIDPGYEPNTPKSIKNHLKLGFDDIVEIKKENFIFRNSKSIDLNNQILPDVNHINKIANFVSTWNQIHPLVIHCWCGVSRSMAAALFVFCKIFPNNIESNVRYMRMIASHANPNKLMISLFEKYLGVEGKINDALKKYPYTVTYDCETTFAPVSIFKINELKKFK
jgi:predicted protein tyrosine phosphatase